MRVRRVGKKIRVLSDNVSDCPSAWSASTCGMSYVHTITFWFYSSEGADFARFRSALSGLRFHDDGEFLLVPSRSSAVHEMFCSINSHHIEMWHDA